MSDENKKFPKGKLNQIAFVVRDIDTAMRTYGDLFQIDPWYRPKPGKDDEIFYRGEKFEGPCMDLVVGYHDQVEVELIQSLGGPSIYTDYLDQCGEGFHHVCFHVRNLREALDWYESRGFVVIQEGSMISRLSRTNYAYVARPGEDPRGVIELSETILLGRVPIIRGKRSVLSGLRFGLIEKVKRD